MSGAKRRVLVAVVGPTGSGKSTLAIELARELGGEIASCDALQVYQGLDIGTAKTGPSEQRGVPHHLFDVVTPDAEFSAASYVRLAAPAVREIESRGRLPIVAGGTGLYLRALRRGLFEGPGRSARIRDRLRRLARRRAGAVHRLLHRVDPESAERIHPNDEVRSVRALEVFLLTGRPMSELMAARERPLPGFRDILVGLGPEREVLARRIEARVDVMFAEGLVDEVQSLRERYGAGVAAFKAIGYREVNLALEGEMTLEEAREATRKASVQYAKRQMTWFRREEDVCWFRGCGDDPSVVAAVSSHLKRELARDGTGQKEKLHETAT